MKKQCSRKEEHWNKWYLKCDVISRIIEFGILNIKYYIEMYALQWKERETARFLFFNMWTWQKLHRVACAVLSVTAILP